MFSTIKFQKLNSTFASLKGKLRKLRKILHSTKMKFPIKDFFSKCDQIRSLLWIWSHLLKKSLKENSIFLQCNIHEWSHTGHRRHPQHTGGTRESLRRNNIRIDAVKKDRKETWKECESGVYSMLKERLDIKNLEIECAHRVGRKSENKPRAIVCRLLRFIDKQNILRKAKPLKRMIYLSTKITAKML